MHRTTCLILAIALVSTQTPNYIGGNNLNTIYNNPNLVDQFLIQTHGKLDQACETIPGIGKAVLSLK